MTVTETRRRASSRPKSISVSPDGAQDARKAMAQPIPTFRSPAGADSHPTSVDAKPMPRSLGGDQSADHHVTIEAQCKNAVGSSGGQGQAAKERPEPTHRTLLDPALALAADVLDDVERVHNANKNRLRQLTRSEEDSDGETRGFGLDERHPDVARLAAIVDMLGKVEHDATLNLQRLMRRHPLYGWSKSMRGVGDKQVARLLAAIGDPYWRPEIVRDDGASIPAGPRTVSAVWAYCGLHVLPASDGRAVAVAGRNGGDPGHAVIEGQDAHARVAPKRQRGQHANWSTKARMRAWNIAESCKKQLLKPCTGWSGGTPAVHADDCQCPRYRLVYDAARQKYADSLHPTACVRCGPKGRPAEPGSPLSAAHQEARALRLVMKEVLKDLWREAKRIHEAAETPQEIL